MTRTDPRRPPRTRPKPRPAAPVADDLKDEDEVGGAERLQKLLASAGLGSRRQCEELITTGRVEVDRKVVTQLGAKADLQRNEIRVDGVALPRPKLVHYLVNKPTGVLCTNSDPAGRPRVIDLLPERGQRVFTVGRLDMYSEGLILLTNDGELANRLTHPRYGVQKTYIVEVAGRIEPEDLAKLTKGVHLAEGFAKVVGARVKSSHKTSSTLEIVLDEGRNREIRRLLARVGHKVQRLKRIAMGPLRLGELPIGGIRPLTREERRELREAASGGSAATQHKQRRVGRQERAAVGSQPSEKSIAKKPIERSRSEHVERPASAAKPNASKPVVGKARPANKTSRPEGGPRADRTARPDRAARPERTVGSERTTRPPRAAKPVQPFQPKPLDEAPRSRTVIGGMLPPDVTPPAAVPPIQAAEPAVAARPQNTGRPPRPVRPGKPRFGKANAGKPGAAKPTAGKSATGKPATGKPATGKPIIGRPGRGRTEFRPVGKTGGKPKRRPG